MGPHCPKILIHHQTRSKNTHRWTRIAHLQLIGNYSPLRRLVSPPSNLFAAPQALDDVCTSTNVVDRGKFGSQLVFLIATTVPDPCIALRIASIAHATSHHHELQAQYGQSLDGHRRALRRSWRSYRPLRRLDPWASPFSSR
jgi:hypothetical protein